jgi:hypothetical protein
MPILSSFGSSAARAYGLVKANSKRTISVGSTVIFSASESFVFPSGVNCIDYLFVGGGGAGGTQVGGGGGGGGYLMGTSYPVSNSVPYTISVGAGGAGNPSFGTTGGSGSNSTIFRTDTGALITGWAIGGGGGGASPGAPAASGGSGGGGGSASGPTGGASGTPGQGNSGGNGTYAASPNRFGSGGGGGAGAAGGSGSVGPVAGIGANGGVGIFSTISGSNTGYAGGGGGGASGQPSDAAAIIGYGALNTGGGNGASQGAQDAGSGGINSGGGGGGSRGGGSPSNIGKGGTGGSGIVIITLKFLDPPPPPVFGYIGWYTASSWIGSQWTDLSGYNNHATTIRGTISVVSGTGNGATRSFNTLQGSTSDGLRFPSGILPSTYTLFHVTRTTGGTRARIVTGSNNNWLSGHWGGGSGIAYHEGWLTDQGDRHGNNWFYSCDQNNLYRSNGTTRGTGGGASTALSINHGNYAEYSDWQCAEVLVYPSTLSSTDYQAVEAWLAAKYGI